MMSSSRAVAMLVLVPGASTMDLAVRSRTITDRFDEQMSMRVAPSFEGLDGGDMPESFLGQLLVVEPHVAVKRLVQIVGAVEAVGSQHLGKPPVEALDHAVGLWMLGTGEAVFDAECSAQLVELMPARRIAGTAGEQPIGELGAVVGEQCLELEGRGLGQRVEEAPGRCGRAVPLDGDEHPARCAIDGHEDVATLALVGHLGQVLDIDVHIPGLVGLEGLAGRSHRLGAGKPGHPPPTQQAVQRRAAHRRLDELVHHGQQIVQRQAQRRAQVHHQFLLPRIQGRLQAVRGVAGVQHGLALAPLAYGVARHVVLARQLVVAAAGRLQRCADRRRGGGVLVQGNQHGLSRSVHPATTAFKTSRPSSSPRLD